MWFEEMGLKCGSESGLGVIAPGGVRIGLEMVMVIAYQYGREVQVPYCIAHGESVR